MKKNDDRLVGKVYGNNQYNWLCVAYSCICRCFSVWYFLNILGHFRKVGERNMKIAEILFALAFGVLIGFCIWAGVAFV